MINIVEKVKVLTFASELPFNGQIMRYFDFDFIEYDLAGANAQLKREEKMFVLQWTSKGYKCVYVRD
jgi:hypothetical protein